MQFNHFLYLTIVHAVWVLDHKEAISLMDLWTKYNAYFADGITWLSSVYGW